MTEINGKQHIIKWIRHKFRMKRVIKPSGKRTESHTIIVDVRTKEEFRDGHIEKSINIPLDRVSGEAGKLREYEHVVVVCASGVRSAQATSILVGKGLKNVFDGGGWQSFKCFKGGGAG